MLEISNPSGKRLSFTALEMRVVFTSIIKLKFILYCQLVIKSNSGGPIQANPTAIFTIKTHFRVQFTVNNSSRYRIRVIKRGYFREFILGIYKGTNFLN